MECTYAEIVEKLEKISHNNSAWNTRKLDTGRNTTAVKATNNPTSDEMLEELAHMRT